jgi:peptidyl-prolyl cis-trans isomerase D
MSVIQTIRNKYGKIAGAVIAIALVGFIISDARNGSFGNFFGGHDSNVMKINGVKIDPKEYQQRLKEYETLSRIYNKTKDLDDAQRAQMDEQAVQSIVEEVVVGEQCDKLGIQTSEDEKKEMIYGPNVDPMVANFTLEGQPIFVNRETHQFDPSIIKQFEKEITEQAQKVDPTGKYKEQWDAVKNYVKRRSRINKFHMMMTNAVYVPLFVSKQAATDQGSMAAIKYVKIPFTSIADNDVKVSDEEVKDYMAKHAAMFQADEPTRSIEYVSFDINPSSADTARSLNALTDIKADFAATKEKDNKSFVSNKTDDVNAYTEAFLNKRTFTSRFADSIMEASVGSVYGPYYENGGYKITKIVEKKTLPDSVKNRHILVLTKYQGNEVATDSAAKMKLDSAIAEIKAGVKFDSVVQKYSVDDGSKAKGGEATVTLLERPAIPKEFGDFLFDGKTGETKTVKVSNDNFSGYYYAEILEQKGIAPAVKTATIVKNLVPSDSTVNAIYGKANEFAGKNTTPELFEAAIKKQNFDKRIGDNIKVTNFSITGLGPAREVVRWMFEHKVGEISPVFQLGQQRYLVAQLISVAEKGMVPLSAANRPQIEQKIREEKKADMISKKYSGSLDAIASASGQQVQQSDSVTAGGGFVPNLGFEPKVIGYTFDAGFQPNTVSPGIKGLGGVYFISVLNRTNAQLPADQNLLMQILASQRRNQEMQLMNGVNQSLQQTIMRKADATYNPSNF